MDFKKILAVFLIAVLVFLIALSLPKIAGKNAGSATTENIPSDSNSPNESEKIDPSQISVNLSPAYIDANAGRDFNVEIINIGKYDGMYSLKTDIPGDEKFLFFDSNEFLIKGKSSKTLNVGVSEKISESELPKKITLCAVRFVGTETVSQTKVVIRACGLVTINR